LNAILQNPKSKLIRTPTFLLSSTPSQLRSLVSSSFLPLASIVTIDDFTMARIIAKFLTFFLVIQAVAAFAPRQTAHPSFVQLEATSRPLSEKIAQTVTTAAVVVATSPLMALAEEVDDYEYGAVNAPIGLAWAVGVLAVGTALLPLALQGGEEAFNEMKEKDADKWGKGGTDALKSKNKKKR
jgi:hypothetical protein